MDWGDRIELAEAEAWRATGRRHRRKIVGFRVTLAMLPFAAAAAAVGALGYACFRAWQAIAPRVGEVDAPVRGVIAGVPPWFWFLSVLVLAVGAVAFRPGRIPSSPGVAVAKVVILLMAIAGLAGLGFSFT